MMFRLRKKPFPNNRGWHLLDYNYRQINFFSGPLVPGALRNLSGMAFQAWLLLYQMSAVGRYSLR
jgi:hypothetical protein